MLVVLSSNSTDRQWSIPGFTALTSPALPVGTHSANILAKVVEEGDTGPFYVTTSLSAVQTTFVCFTVTGGPDLDGLVVGPSNPRSGGVGTSATRNHALAISVPQGGIALAISLEATLATNEVPETWSVGTPLHSTNAAWVQHISVADLPVVAGSAGPVDITYSQTQANNGNAIILGIGPQTETESLSVYNGEGAPVSVFYTGPDGTEDLRTPTDIFSVPRGYTNVSDMLSGEFWWAHRGGSAIHQEMSLDAYTQSVVSGYGGLEVSLARTSDGVWFGLHDNDINRVSGTTGLGPASDMSWADVQSYQINLSGRGPAQPFMRWEEIVTAYGDSHILSVDPKFVGASSLQDEFLSMVANDVGKDRAIIKGYVSTPNLSLKLSAQGGWHSWGYMYPSDIDGGVSDWETAAAKWTMLGLTYDADAPYWNQVLALGKPVVGHIIPNQAGVETARSRGASGFQCANTRDIVPLR